MIVATLFKGNLRWFDSDPDYWVLDYSKWGESFKDAGYDVDASDCSDRFDIPVVDEKTAALFLDRMKESAVPLTNYVINSWIQWRVQSAGTM